MVDAHSSTLPALPMVGDIRSAWCFPQIPPGNWEFIPEVIHDGNSVPFLCLHMHVPQSLYSFRSINLHTGVHLLLRGTSLTYFYQKLFLRSSAYSCIVCLAVPMPVTQTRSFLVILHTLYFLTVH